jgi:hypothetical protein
LGKPRPAGGAVAPNSDFAVEHRLDGFGNQALKNGVSDDFLAKVIRYALNHHPRKTLNWLTSTQGLSGIFNVALRG